MGSAGDFIRKTARDAALKAMQRLSQGTTGDTSQIFTIGCLNADQTKVTLPNGEVYNCQLKGQVAQPCNPVVRLNSTTYLMIGTETKMVQSDGGKSIWAMLAVYPPGAAFFSGFGPIMFPVFNVMNFSTLKQYYVPASMLPDVFEVDPDPDAITTDNGYKGVWASALNPNANTLVVVRVKHISRREQEPPFPPGLGIIPTTDTYSIKAYWNIIKNFGIDGETGRITSTDSTAITGGTRIYIHNMAVPGISDIPTDQMPVLPPTYTFNGWYRATTTKNLDADPVISFNADGDARIDLYGKWDSTLSAQAGYDDSTSPGVVKPYPGLGLFHLRTVGGLWNVKDLSVTGAQSSTNYGGSIDRRPLFGYTPSSALGYVSTSIWNTFSIRSLLLNTSDHRWGEYDPSSNEFGGATYFKYSSKEGVRAAAAFKFSSTGAQIPKMYFATDYSTLTDESDYNDNFSTKYIGDETRFYPVSQATTGWQTRHNSDGASGLFNLPLSFIKTVGTGRFQELYITYSSVGLHVEKVRNWRWNSDTQVIEDAGEMSAKEAEAALTVLGDGETYTDLNPHQITIMDFVVRNF